MHWQCLRGGKGRSEGRNAGVCDHVSDTHVMGGVLIGNLLDMRIAMDAVGRLVVPKALRAELGITGPTELEVIARDGLIELAVADVPARINDHRSIPVIVADGPMKPLTVEDVRAAIDRVRR